jgi:O-antigen/teichoic acid export membrane protein
MSDFTPAIAVDVAERQLLDREVLARATDHPSPVTDAALTGRWRLTDLSRRFPALSNGALSIVDQAIVSGTSFVTAVIINRTVSAVEVGIYYVTLSMVIIALGIQENVVVTPYVIYSKRRQGRELAAYVGSSWLQHFTLTALCMLALIVAIVGFSLTGAVEIVPGLWALLVASPLLLLREGIRRFAIADLNIGTAMAVDALVAAAQIGGLILVGYFGGLSIFSIYGVMAVACGLACLAWYLLNATPIQFERSRFWPDWRTNWAFAKWSLQGFLVGSTAPYLMPWVVSIAVGAAAAGVLGACVTLVGLTTILLCGVDRVLGPRAALAYVTGGTQALRHVLFTAAAILTIALGTFCLFAFATGSLLPVLVYGEQFQDTGPLLGVLALGGVVTGLGMVAGNGLWAIEQPRSNFFADVIGLAVTIGTAACLVVPFGPLGAALATLAGASTSAVTRFITLIWALDTARLASVAGSIGPATYSEQNDLKGRPT